MSELFYGEFENKLDRKGRVSIPVSFRRVLEANDPDWKTGENPNLMVLFGWPGNAGLEIFSMRSYLGMLEKLKRLPARSLKRKNLSRLLASRATKLQLDETGRVTLSAQLLEFGQLKSAEKAIFAGMVESFEIWNPEDYETATQETLTWFDDNIDQEDPLAELSGATE